MDINPRLARLIGKSLGDLTEPPSECLTTGSVRLDRIIGGGYPLGRMSGIFGPSGAGKSQMAFNHARAVLEEHPGASVLIIDTENAIDMDRLRGYLGDNIDRCVVIEEMNTGRIGDLVYEQLKRNIWWSIIIDSIAGAIPDSVENAPTEAANIGIEAKQIRRAILKWKPALKSSKRTDLTTGEVQDKGCVMLWTNEAFLGLMSSANPVPEEKRGTAVKHAPQVRIRLRDVAKSRILKSSDGQIAQVIVSGNIIKSRKKGWGMDFEIPINVTGPVLGTDKLAEIVSLAQEMGIVTSVNGGKWSNGSPMFEGEKIDLSGIEVPKEVGSGKSVYMLKMYLYEHPEMMDRILERIMSDEREDETGAYILPEGGDDFEI